MAPNFLILWIDSYATFWDNGLEVEFRVGLFVNERLGERRVAFPIVVAIDQIFSSS